MRDEAVIYRMSELRNYIRQLCRTLNRFDVVTFRYKEDGTLDKSVVQLHHELIYYWKSKGMLFDD